MFTLVLQAHCEHVTERWIKKRGGVGGVAALSSAEERFSLLLLSCLPLRR